MIDEGVCQRFNAARLEIGSGQAQRRLERQACQATGPHGAQPLPGNGPDEQPPVPPDERPPAPVEEPPRRPGRDAPDPTPIDDPRPPKPKKL